MRVYFLLVFLVWGSNAYAFSWEVLQGCYYTLERNGEAVPEYQKYKGRIAFGEASFMKDSAGNSIPSLEFMIFKKQLQEGNKSIVYYDYHPIFLHMGNYWSDANGEHFNFDGIMQYDFGGNQHGVFTLHQSATIRVLADDKYFLEMHRKIPEMSDGTLDSDNTYILQRTECAASSVQ